MIDDTCVSPGPSHHHQHAHAPSVRANLVYPPNTVFGMRGSDIDKYSRQAEHLEQNEKNGCFEQIKRGAKRGNCSVSAVKRPFFYCIFL